MNCGTRIGAILNLQNFNKAFRWLFPSNDDSGWRRTNKDKEISQKEIANIIFSVNKNRRSETECGLLATSAFRLNNSLLTLG